MIDKTTTSLTPFPTAQIGIDLNGYIISWNEAAEKVFGYSENEMLKQKFDILLPFGKTDDMNQMIHTIIAGGRIENQRTYRISKSGELLLCRITILIQYDKNGSIYGILSNEQQYSLITSIEEKMALLYPSYSNGMAVMEVVFDENNKPKDFRIKECNKGFEILMMYPSEFMLGKSIYELTPDGFRHLVSKVIEVVNTGGSNSFDSYIPTLDKYYKIFISMLHEKQISVMMYDVTDTLKREKELKQRYKELNELYEELSVSQEELRQNYEALEGLKEVADRANKAKGQFLANMSHEIRTPINGIFGMMNLLESSNLNEEQYEFVNALKYSASHLLDIVNDILDISRIESGKYKLTFAEFNLKSNIDKMVKIFKVNANTKNIEIKKEYSKNLPHEFLGDSLRINQILYNLLENAIKFTEEGSIALKVEEQERSEDSIKLLFTIEDSGVGIPDGLENELFEMFTQGDSSYTKKYSGTGLGLAICKKLVSLMDGEIWYESELGKGTRFYYTIKLKLPISELVAYTPFPQYTNNVNEPIMKEIVDDCCNLRTAIDEDRKKMVLIADDNEINQMVINRYLSKKGYGSICVFDGRAIIDKISEDNIGMILMDIQMPEVNGIEATHMIRNSELGGDVHMPIIAMTSYAMDGDRETFIAAGMDDYLSKPIDFKLLDNILEKYFV